MYTYERDDGTARSWIDHILCSRTFSSLISDVYTLRSDCILSDHYPLCFSLKANCPSIPITSFTYSKPVRTNWSNVSHSDIEKYNAMVSQRISSLPPEVFNCSHPHCTIHQNVLDSYSQHLVFTLLTCSSQCFPTISSSSSRKLAGWNDSTTNLKRTANFWHKLWNDAGCPSSGVLFQLKQNTKKKYKREVRRLTRRQKFLLQKKLARSFSKKNKNSFWADVKSSSTSAAPTVDNMHDCGDIANVFASNYKTILNTHSLGSHLSLNSTLDSLLTEEEVCGDEFSGHDVLEAILQLKMGKADAEGIFSEQLIFASTALTEPLASFLHHSSSWLYASESS